MLTNETDARVESYKRNWELLFNQSVSPDLSDAQLDATLSLMNKIAAKIADLQQGEK